MFYYFLLSSIFLETKHRKKGKKRKKKKSKKGEGNSKPRIRLA